ncbi:hypothetical protein F210042A8_26680 [Blautia parvula]
MLKVVMQVSAGGSSRYRIKMSASGIADELEWYHGKISPFVSKV